MTQNLNPTASSTKPTAAATDDPPSRPDHNLWPSAIYTDAPAARQWLGALGFIEGIYVPDEADPALIRHSEMLWPAGGRVMVSSTGRSGAVACGTGTIGVYVPCDDPESVWTRAQDLGAEVVLPLERTDYGSLGFTIRDPEGHSWSFGTYAG